MSIWKGKMHLGSLRRRGSPRTVIRADGRSINASIIWSNPQRRSFLPVPSPPRRCRCRTCLYASRWEWVQFTISSPSRRIPSRSSSCEGELRWIPIHHSQSQRSHQTPLTVFRQKPLKERGHRMNPYWNDGPLEFLTETSRGLSSMPKKWVRLHLSIM